MLKLAMRPAKIQSVQVTTFIPTHKITFIVELDADFSQWEDAKPAYVAEMQTMLDSSNVEVRAWQSRRNVGEHRSGTGEASLIYSLLGKFDSVDECRHACTATDGCDVFMWHDQNQGPNAEKCWGRRKAAHEQDHN